MSAAAQVVRMWGTRSHAPVSQARQYRSNHGALRWMSAAPCSSYSLLDIHICWKEPSDARMDPPAHKRARPVTRDLGVTASAQTGAAETPQRTDPDAEAALDRVHGRRDLDLGGLRGHAQQLTLQPLPHAREQRRPPCAQFRAPWSHHQLSKGFWPASFVHVSFTRCRVMEPAPRRRAPVRMMPLYRSRRMSRSHLPTLSCTSPGLPHNAVSKTAQHRLVGMVGACTRAGMRDGDMRAWQALEVGAIVRLHRRQARKGRQHTLRGHRTARLTAGPYKPCS